MHRVLTVPSNISISKDLIPKILHIVISHKKSTTIHRFILIKKNFIRTQMKWTAWIKDPLTSNVAAWGYQQVNTMLSIIRRIIWGHCCISHFLLVIFLFLRTISNVMALFLTIKTLPLLYFFLFQMYQNCTWKVLIYPLIMHIFCQCLKVGTKWVINFIGTQVVKINYKIDGASFSLILINRSNFFFWIIISRNSILSSFT